MDAASPLPYIDLQRLALNNGGNKHAMKDMLDVFLKTTGESIHKLDVAVKTQDAGQWLILLQHLRHNANRVTAKRIAALCFDAERITQLPHEQADSLIYHFQKELAQLRDVIAKQLSEFGRLSLL